MNNTTNDDDWTPEEWDRALRQAGGDPETASLILQDAAIESRRRENPTVETDDGETGPEFESDD